MSAAGWATRPLLDIAELYQGYGFPKTLQGRSTGDLGFYKVSDISRAAIAGNEYLGPAVHCITNDDARSLRATPLPKDSVVFARIGEAINLNRRALLPADALVDNNVIGAKARPGIGDRYLLHFLNTVRLGLLSQATTVPAVRTSDIAAIEVPVAPANEQRRIVSKIDELFRRIDEGEQALKRVEKLVERYRQSVLKAAVTGELTREWRAARKRAGEAVESGAALLARILKARRAAWETTELAKLKAKGKPPTDDRWKQKYQEPTPPDVADLPELPEGWVWASPVQLESDDAHALTIGPFGSDLKVSDYAASGVPLVFVRNIRSASFQGSGTKFVSIEKADALSAHKVRSGDILITKMGDPPGDACVYPANAPDAIVTADCIKWTLHPLLSSPLFICTFVVSRFGKEQIRDITTGVAQQKVSLSRFRRLAIAVPGLQEQCAINDRVTQVAEQISRIETEVADGLMRAAALRQSILKAAFSGQLVPQDPRDEPASKLLERIATERATAPALRQRKKKSA